jgi:hypothetical protein
MVRRATRNAKYEPTACAAFSASRRNISFMAGLVVVAAVAYPLELLVSACLGV